MPLRTTFSTGYLENASAPNLNPIGSLDDAKNRFNQDAEAASVKALKDALGTRNLNDPTLLLNELPLYTMAGHPMVPYW